MSATIIKNEGQAKQNRIFNTLKNLVALPKVTVSKEENQEGISTIWIWHDQEYFPGFELQWSTSKKYYRVYIHVASTTSEKKNAGYCICNIPNGFAAAGFVMLYGFIHKHRSNNKTEAIA